MAVRNLHIPLSLSWMLLAAIPVRVPLCLPSGILIPFLTGNIPVCFPAWESIAKIAPFKLTPNILRWIQDYVDVREFFQPFKGQYKGKVLILLYPLVGSSLTPFLENPLRSSFLTLLFTVCHLLG